MATAEARAEAAVGNAAAVAAGEDDFRMKTTANRRGSRANRAGRTGRESREASVDGGGAFVRF